MSYLVGAVPTAYLIARLVRGIDIRQYGSGNVGGANLVRQVGKAWLAPLVLFEVLVKGVAPVWLGRQWLGLDSASMTLLVAPLLALAGHNWSVYLKLQGGRGLVVVVGSLLVLSPWLLGASLAVFLAGWLATRSAAVWSLVALALLPLGVGLVGQPQALVWYCIGALTLVVLKRLVSNWTPLPPGLPRSKVLLNRLLRDRDVDRREDWVGRVPGATEG